MKDEARVLSRLARKLRLAQFVLVWERLWPALWPAVAATGLFLVFSLIAVYALLPGWLHAAALVAFAAGFVIALLRGVRPLRWPAIAETQRRLEIATGLAHRPLETIGDSLRETRDVATASLWEAHRQRAWALVRRLRAGMPRAGLAARDPRGIRVAIALLVIVGFVVAGSEWQVRLAQAFTPRFSQTGPLEAELAAWIAPPAYTAVAPLFLTPPPGQDAERFTPPSDASGPLLIPAGSTFFGSVHGGRGAPEFRVDGEATAFTIVDSDNYQISQPLTHGERLAVAQGRGELGGWRITVVPDLAPTVEFANAIGVTERATMRIAFGASDDYGLASARLRIQRSVPGGDAASFDIPLPEVNPRQAEGTRAYDLTPHPWAGLPVRIWLEAADGIEQVGMSRVIEMRLPEREFTNPIARAIIEQRRNLAEDPSRREVTAFALDAISEALADEAGDLGSYLSLRSAISRLERDSSEGAVAEVIDQLWDTALGLEEGRLGLAERDLRRAQQALQDALSRDAPNEEIERLINELREAIEDYLQAMAEDALRNPDRFSEVPPNENARPLSAQDLMDMLEQARDLNRLGARDAAQQLLSELQQMLENLHMGMQGQQAQPGEAGEALQELGEMMQRQQQLMDRTFQQEQRGAFGDLGQLPSPGEQQALQERLRQMMQGLGEGIGQVPEALGDAAEAMGQAAEALREGDAGGALGRQNQALDGLRQGAAQVLEQMLAEGGGLPENRNAGENPEPQIDPLGRPAPGMGADISDRVKVPDKSDLQRTREILEELFRRASERGRPLLELDYIERLLRRF